MSLVPTSPTAAMNKSDAYQEIRVEFNGLTFAAKSWGDPDAFPLIAVHGWLDNANTFDLIAPMLKHCRLISLDMAGHGLSGHRVGGVHYHFMDHVTDLFAIIDALEIKEFSLLGHSMGAAITSIAAATFPERVRNLFLIDGLGIWTRPISEHISDLRSAIKLQRKKKTRPLYSSIDEAVAARIKGTKWEISEQAVRILVARGLQKLPEGYTWRTDNRLFLPSTFRFTEEQNDEFMRRIDAPVDAFLALKGTALFDGFIDKRKELIRDITLYKLEGGHHLHLENQTEFIADTINARMV